MTVTLCTWLTRAAWASLPLTAGPALASALGSWDETPRLVGAVLLWSAWGAVLLAHAVPRPLSATVIRTASPLALAVLLLALSSGRPSALASGVALGAVVAHAPLAASPLFGRACAQGAAYGDEERFPLKVPPALFLGLLPGAVLLVGAGVASGPLLLADGNLLLGIGALVIGVPVAVLLARSLHLLSRRWVVLVPAGVVVADPMTITDPVLFPREHIRSLAPFDARHRPPGDVLDLRLGAASGSLLLVLDDRVELVRRVRTHAERVSTSRLLVAAVSGRVLLERAVARRLPAAPAAGRDVRGPTPERPPR